MSSFSHHVLLYLKTLYIVWSVMRRRVTRRLTTLQTMFNVLKYRKTWWNYEDLLIYRNRNRTGNFVNLIMHSTVIIRSACRASNNDPQLSLSVLQLYGLVKFFEKMYQNSQSVLHKLIIIGMPKQKAEKAYSATSLRYQIDVISGNLITKTSCRVSLLCN